VYSPLFFRVGSKWPRVGLEGKGYFISIKDKVNTVLTLTLPYTHSTAASHPCYAGVAVADGSL